MPTIRSTTLATAAAVTVCRLGASHAFMIPTPAAAGRGPLSTETRTPRRSAGFDSCKQASLSPSRTSASSDRSSKPLPATPASTPEAAAPAVAEKTTGAPSEEQSVPSSAGRKKTCDSGFSSAPSFSYRKTFWQPFLPAEKSGPDPFPRSAAADRASSASSTPANDPPKFLYRKTFWQPFARAGLTAAAEAAVATTSAAAATAAPATDESAPPSPSGGRETASGSSSSSASTFLYRKTYWQPFLAAEKSDSDSLAGSAAAGRESSGSSSSAPANDPPSFLYRKTFRQPFATAAASVGSPTAGSAKGPEPASSTASPAATAASATTPETPATPATAEADLPAPEKESPGGASPLPPPFAAEEVPPPLAAKAESGPPPPVAFEPEPSLISDSPLYQGAALNMKRAKEAFAPFTRKIQDNVAEGNVGERGEEWAIAQGVIIFFIGMGSVPVIGGLVMLLAGPGLVAAGAGVIAAGGRGLGKSLSPWPAPVEDNKLSTDGIYGMVRHPMYTGVVMLSLGFGVLTESPLRMLLAVTLALVLDKKAAKEEEMLLGLHGEAYADYLEAVAKFVPRLY